MRTIIIGDIHGCSDALRTLLSKVKPNEKEDRLIFMGDLFDRGPDSWGVFQVVQKLAAGFGDRFVLLRGNHEDYLLAEKLSFPMLLMWNRVGRGATVQSFKSHRDKMENSVPWLKEHVVPYYRGEGFQCVHAGVKIEPLELNDFQTMIHDHGVAMENRYAGPLTIVGHIALDEPTWFPGEGKEIRKIQEGTWQDLPDKGILCVDTGCGKGGRLTAMVIEDGRFILQSASSI